MTEDLVPARVTEVWVEPTGDVTLAAYAIAAVTLQLGDVSDFSDEGGRLAINGIIYTYLTRDVTLDTVTLAPGGLSAAVADGDHVYIYPLSQEKWAHAQAEFEEDQVKARIPHSLADKFLPGVRDEDMQESVILNFESDGYVVRNIVAKEPTLTFRTAESGPRIRFHGSDGVLLDAPANLGVVSPFLEANDAVLSLIGPDVAGVNAPVIFLVGDTSGSYMHMKSDDGVKISTNQPWVASGTAIRCVGFGVEINLATNASGECTINHGMSDGPVAVAIIPHSANPNHRYAFQHSGVTGTTFKLEVRLETTDALVVSSNTSFSWIALA
jgi:hypothetical protein